MKIVSLNPTPSARHQPSRISPIPVIALAEGERVDLIVVGSDGEAIRSLSGMVDLDVERQEEVLLLRCAADPTLAFSVDAEAELDLRTAGDMRLLLAAPSGLKLHGATPRIRKWQSIGTLP